MQGQVQEQLGAPAGCRAANIIRSMPCINDHEYTIFSQNGEDGIISFLSSGLQSSRRQFIEIGTSDGGENNSMYLLRKH